MKDLYFTCGLFVLKYEGPIMGSLIGILLSYCIHELYPAVTATF